LVYRTAVWHQHFQSGGLAFPRCFPSVQRSAFSGGQRGYKERRARMIMTEQPTLEVLTRSTKWDDGSSFLVLSFSLRESLLAGQLPRESWCEGGKVKFTR
jgi:hypothetical protein